MVNKLSRKLHLAKRFVALLLVMALSLAGVSMAEEAPTSVMADYQDVVSTYSINDEIKSYKDYIEELGGEDLPRPMVSQVVEAKDFTRYEALVSDVVVTEPLFYTVDENGLPVPMMPADPAGAVEPVVEEPVLSCDCETHCTEAVVNSACPVCCSIPASPAISAWNPSPPWRWCCR